MLGKLTSDLCSFIDSQDDVLRSGRMALNVAMTAWHMADWIFVDMDVKQRDFVSRRLGRSIERFPDFLAAATDACVPLRICQVIATAGKHGEVSRRPDPSLVTRLKFVEVDEPDGDGAIMAIWVIEHGGMEILATDVFVEVHRFWEDILSDLGMIEDPVPGRVERGW